MFAIVVAAVVRLAGGADQIVPPEALRASTWTAGCPAADRTLLDPAAVAAANRRVLDLDASVRDLATIPATLAGPEVAAVVGGLSQPSAEPLVHDDGTEVGPADRDRWRAAVDLARIPPEVTPAFGLVTRRASLRLVPTAERIRRAGGPADIDRFQESAFFPGTPVAAIHATADGRWTFVLGTTYAAWIETAALAFAPRETVLDFARRSTRIVVAPRVMAVPQAAGGASDGVSLDMGTALPESSRAAVAAEGTAASAPLVELPLRARDGSLVLVPARVEPAAGVRAGPLPASRRNLLEQAFRFLGEPYGWGHDHGVRDCSGFVCDVYRSLGILLPRNTRDQSVSPALDRIVVDPGWARDRRLAEIGRLLPGDLVYVPRHVMMIVGHDAAGPWVIHDTHSGRLAGSPDDAVARGVVVAPLERILVGDDRLAVDAVTVLVRVLPAVVCDPP